jgi:hypothetical protein
MMLRRAAKGKPRLLPSRRPGPLADIAIFSFPFHLCVALDGSRIVRHSALSRVREIELEIDLVPFHRAREIRFAEQPVIGSGKLLAILLENERGTAATLGGVHIEFPPAGDIVGQQGHARQPGQQHYQRKSGHAQRIARKLTKPTWLC